MMRIFFFTLSLIFSMNLQAQEQKNSNRHFSHTATTTASAEAIWQVWTDVPNWKNWDSGLKDASMEDRFGLNAKGEILSLEDRSSAFEIVEYQAGESYTMKTRLPLGSLFVRRFLEQKDGSTVFTHEVWFAGISRGLFASTFGKKFRAMLPEVLENIKEIVEK